MNRLSGLLIPFLLISAMPVQAQWERFEGEAPPDGFGFFEANEVSVCLPDHLREEIKQQISANIEMLRAQGRAMPSGNGPIELTMPLRAADHYPFDGFHGISNFVDHNPAYPNQLLDYMCGERTYDTATGYNHRGIDYFGWPFSWYQMDHDYVEIVAAAPGMIINRVDGNFDRNCNFNNPNWNAVYILHDDNSIAWYGHLKKDSVTPKQIGDFVERGEYLGVMGSSGASTGPHLHFELYDADNNLIDPYEGPCNSLIADTWWQDQHEYYDSALLAVSTHNAPPVFPTCPQTEIPNYMDEFQKGEQALLAAYYRDQRQGQITQYSLLGPSGAVLSSWSHSMNVPHYAASYWYWTFNIPQNADDGLYKFRATYQGKTLEHEFLVGTLASTEPGSDIPVAFKLDAPWPNPFNPSTRFSLQLTKPQHVVIDVINLAGQRVALISDKMFGAGTHQDFVFYGDGLSSGIYIIRAVGARDRAYQKVTLIK